MARLAGDRGGKLFQSWAEELPEVGAYRRRLLRRLTQPCERRREVTGKAREALGETFQRGAAAISIQSVTR